MVAERAQSERLTQTPLSRRGSGQTTTQDCAGSGAHIFGSNNTPGMFIRSVGPAAEAPLPGPTAGEGHRFLEWIGKAVPDSVQKTYSVSDPKLSRAGKTYWSTLRYALAREP